MQVRQIRYFVAVAETLNFTKAAAVCGVSQPALSRSIHQLEEELGGALVYRQGVRTCLTPLGHALLPAAQRAHAAHLAVREAAHSFLAHNHDRLRLGAAGSCAPQRLLALVAEVTAKAPEIQVEIVQGGGRELEQKLLRSDLDGVVATFDPLTLDKGMRVTPLYRDRLVIALPPAHRLAAGLLRRADLAAMPVFEILELELNLDACLGFETADLQRVRCTRVDMALLAVGKGMGFTVIPESLLGGSGLIGCPLPGGAVQELGLKTVRGRRFSAGLAELVRVAAAQGLPSASPGAEPCRVRPPGVGGAGALAQAAAASNAKTLGSADKAVSAEAMTIEGPRAMRCLSPFASGAEKPARRANGRRPSSAAAQAAEPAE